MNIILRCCQIFSLALLAACGKATVELEPANYAEINKATNRCRNSRVENLLDVPTSVDTPGYALRAPANFDPHRRHPLLVVFPAAGHTSRQSEAFTKFTKPATARGFIIIYPAHRTLSLPQIDRFAALVDSIAQQWCVDSSRIYFTGHSDGGTVSHVLSQRTQTNIKPSRLAPSAAGIRAADLDGLGCKQQASIMLMHNKDDELFPAFGRSARDWWLRCNGCDEHSSHRDPIGCETYRNCAGASEVKYCEASGGHREWPQAREHILDFLIGVEAS